MLTVLTTSLNYADYLSKTLPYTKAIADRVIVITSEDDQETAEAAQNAGAEIFTTPVFSRNGAVFAKGSAINEALQAHRRSLVGNWLLHLDADVIVPQRLDLTSLNKAALYGAQRQPIIGRDSFELFKLTGRARAARGRFISRPIGFFQLWHADNWKDYPTLSDNASWDDMEFIKLFPHTELPFKVYHLQTFDLRRRSNWNGRTTKAF